MTRKTILTACALVLVMSVLLACLGADVPLDFLLQIGTGWAQYLVRVVPRLTINWGGVASAVICLALLTGGLHLFLRWYYQQTRQPADAAGDDQAPRSWRFQWTLALVGVVMLMFVAGTAAVGLTHQTIWLMTAPVKLTQGGDVVARISATNNLRQIGLAMHIHHDAHQRFPAGATLDSQGRILHGWQTRLLPYIEQNGLYRAIDQKLPWDHPANKPYFRQPVQIYQYPGLPPSNDAGLALSHFAGNVDFFGGDRPRSLSDLDGNASTTMVAGEAGGNYQPWGYPMNWRDPAQGINRSPSGFGHPSRHGVLFLFADGHVQFVPENMDPQYWGR